MRFLENSDEEFDYLSDSPLDPYHASDEDDSDYEPPQENRHNSGSSADETLENINRFIQDSQPQQMLTDVEEELFLQQDNADSDEQRGFDDIPMGIDAAESLNPVEHWATFGFWSFSK